MNYRYMRTLLFFDLPTLTSKNKKDYRKFVKDLKKCGFYRIQESVFVKMHINQQNADFTLNQVNGFKPSDGSIITLTITEQQFARMKILLGEIKTDVETSDERILEI